MLRRRVGAGPRPGGVWCGAGNDGGDRRSREAREGPRRGAAPARTVGGRLAAARVRSDASPMTTPGAHDEAFLTAVETHDVGALQALLAGGFDARAPVRGKGTVQWLLEMYLRSERFAPCLRLLLAAGAPAPAPGLLPVLLDDAAEVQAALHREPGLVQRRFDLVSAFTPLLGASLLHVAAEYGQLQAAHALLAAGADVEARAATTADGGDGHTPLFHTVNSMQDHGAGVRQALLAAGARTDVRLSSLTWGRGFDWETTWYDVTPVSYCQAGLSRQMHRRELDVQRTLAALLAAAGRPAPSSANVPNRYLQPRR